MNWLPVIEPDMYALLERPVSSTEAAAYRQRTGMSRWSLGFDLSRSDSIVFAVGWIMLCVAVAVLMPLLRHWLVLVVVALTALAGLAGIVLYRASERSIRQHVRMNEFAARCGLRYTPLEKTDAIGMGLLFDVGHSRRYRGVLYYEAGGRRLLEVGRYEYTIGSGKHQQTYRWWYTGLRVPRNVPHMVLDSKRNDTTLMGKLAVSTLPVLIPHSQRISLEGDFDTYFTLYAPKQYAVDARYIFTPDVMATLIDLSSGFDVELIDDMVFFYMPHRAQADTAIIKDLFTVLTVAGRELDWQIVRYADNRVENARSKNRVTEQGRRLKQWKRAL